MPGEVRQVNPFGSQFTKPGALPFLMADGRPLSDGRQELAARIAAHWRTAIVGQHGSGKSTLVRELSGTLEALFQHQVSHARLRIGQPCEDLWAALRNLAPGGLLIADGYQCLPIAARIRLLIAARRRPVRLLITAHPTVFLPHPLMFRVIAATDPTEAVARRLLDLLLADYPQDRTAMLQAFERLYPANRENLRQVWAMMYDAYETHLHHRSSPAARES